jgi:uncharacterized membrane protein
MLLYLGLDWPARVIHLMYRPLCHQLPQRSFFLFGPQLTYRLEELADRLGPAFTDAPWSGAFAGSAELGYKMALCQRDIAIYAAIAAAGLIYGLLRRRWRVRPLPWWAYLGFGVIPMLVDGGYQWISYAVTLLLPGSPLMPHETTPMLRVVTGGLFGLCTVWLAYPHVEDTMADVWVSQERRMRGRQAVAKGDLPADVLAE